MHFGDIRNTDISDDRSAIFGKILNIILRFCRRSTFHGFNQIANAKNIRQRIFWMIICFTASTGFFVNIYYLIMKYMEVPILTNVYQNYESFTFPDVSFCFTNPIYFPPTNSFAYYQLKKTYRKYKYFRNSAHPFLTHRVNLADFLFMQKSDSYGHQPSTSIVSCDYMGFPCNYSHFEILHIYAYGICYTFNSTKIFNRSIKNISSISHVKNPKPQFQVVIYKAVDMVPDFIEDPFGDVTMPSGIILMMHEEDTFPSVASGYILDTYSQINLKITTKKHLNIRQKCRLSRPKHRYFDVFSNSSKLFTETLDACVFVATQTKVMEYCNCMWPRFPPIEIKNTTKYCLDGSVPMHILKYCLPKAYLQLKNNHLSICYKDMCEHKIFETVISQSKFPAVEEKGTHIKWLQIMAKIEENEFVIYNNSDMKFKALKNNINIQNLTVSEAYKQQKIELLDEEFIDRNFAMIRIIPSSLFIDKVEEMVEYPMSRLISDIGGSVGLWVGASLITIFEFLDILFDVFESKIILPKKSNKKLVSKKETNSADPNDELEDITHDTIEML